MTFQVQIPADAKTLGDELLVREVTIVPHGISRGAHKVARKPWLYKRNQQGSF